MIAHAPDVLVLVSPHAPRRRDRFGIVAAPWIAGSFARFGRARLATRLPGAPDAARRIETAAARRDLESWTPPGDDLDHGALVPLHFLVEAGWTGPDADPRAAVRGRRVRESDGEAVETAADEAGERWVVIASGDMSHRLQPGAPAGFDPRAHGVRRELRRAPADRGLPRGVRAGPPAPGPRRRGRRPVDCRSLRLRSAFGATAVESCRTRGPSGSATARRSCSPTARMDRRSPRAADERTHVHAATEAAAPSPPPRSRNGRARSSERTSCASRSPARARGLLADGARRLRHAPLRHRASSAAASGARSRASRRSPRRSRIAR